MSVQENNQDTVKKKSHGIALILCLFFGILGAHRYYLGKIKSAIFCTLTFGGFGFLWLYDWLRLTFLSTKKFSTEYSDSSSPRDIRIWSIPLLLLLVLSVSFYDPKLDSKRDIKTDFQKRYDEDLTYKREINCIAYYSLIRDFLFNIEYKKYNNRELGRRYTQEQNEIFLRKPENYYHSSLFLKRKEEIKNEFINNFDGLQKEVRKCAIELQVNK